MHHSGRLIQSHVEAPERPVAVQPQVNTQPSRPESAYGYREGVFQQQLSGEYPVNEHLPSADDLLVSSTSSPTAPVAESRLRSDTHRALSVYYQNVRGLRTKIDELFLAVIDCDYDVIVLTETWLDDTIFSPQLFGTIYNVYRNDRDTAGTGKKIGGGICIAVSKKFDSTCFPVPTDRRSLEQLWVVINGVANQKLYIGSVYISPDLARNSEAIEAHINSAFTVAEALRPNDSHLLLGDYNQPKIVWTKSTSSYAHPSSSSASYPTSSSTLLDGMALLGMKQMNDVINNLNRTLDLVLINDDAVNCCSVTEAPDALLRIDPAHPPLEVSISLRMPVPFVDDADTHSYNFYKADYPALNQALLGVDWSVIEEMQDVNQAVAFFNVTLQSLFREHVPTRPPPKKPPWSNERMKKLKRRRAAALRKYSARRNPVTHRAFSIASKRYTQYKRHRYGIHVRRTQENLKRNPKRFWSFVNEKRKETGLPAKMFLGETNSSSTRETCNLFAQHFSSVFRPSSATPDQVNDALRVVPTDVLHLDPVSFTEEDVQKAIAKLKSSSSAGPDGIPSIVLKSCAAAVTKPLLLIFNLSIRTETFPNCWKSSYMFPIFKKGDKRDVSNYRGITSLCAGSKLMEIVVNELLTNATKSYISTSQHGFFSGRSTSTNLVDFISFCLRNMEGGGQVDAVYTDLKAAFDRIDHRILLAKLDKLGISSNFVRWIESYLTGRILSVKIGASESAPFCMTSGVPQGSNTGPRYFCVYYNDVTFVLPPGCRILYADDLKIYHPIHNEGDCRVLQQLIESFTQWCALNLLSVSFSKCSIISFTRKKLPVIWPYTIGDQPLERVTVVKDLGVLLEEKLSFSSHCNAIISKANRNLGFMFRIASEFRDPACLRALYYALVRSHLETAVVAWSPFTDEWVTRIESVQRKFTRFALRFHPWPVHVVAPSYEQRCEALGMATLAQRRLFLRAAFVGKLLLGAIDAPSILARINLNVIPRPLRTRNALRLDFHRTQYGQQEPIRAMCNVFNDFDDLFDYFMSVDSFISSLRRTIFV